MLHDLSLCPATVARLARDHDLSLPAIHKHIRLMEQAGLILRKKVGRTNFMALKTNALIGVQAWIGQYHTEWGNDAATLDNYISRMQE